MVTRPQTGTQVDRNAAILTAPCPGPHLWSRPTARPAAPLEAADLQISADLQRQIQSSRPSNGSTGAANMQGYADLQRQIQFSRPSNGSIGAANMQGSADKRSLLSVVFSPFERGIPQHRRLRNNLPLQRT
eukprot:362032-Chlamydomonas_euryale.AAC.5